MLINRNVCESDLKNEICNGLDRLGIQQGDTLLVHSSLKSLSYERIDADLVLEALLGFLTKQGTLLMPSLSYITVNSSAPNFLLNGTPSCVGALTEAFRAFQGTVRSLHPTHSVCANGKYAYELTEAHFKDTTPVGPNSPFSLLPNYDGKILFIGCGITPNTSMHGVEEAVSTPYLMNKEKTRFILRDRNGKTSEVHHYTHDFKGYVQRYDRIIDYLEESDYKEGNIMEARSCVINSKSLWIKGSQTLKINPYTFVDRI